MTSQTTWMTLTERGVPGTTVVVLPESPTARNGRAARILRPVKFSEVGADYRWLEMPDVQPAVGDYVWFAIGGYDRPGFRSNPGLEGVWNDCLEFTEKTDLSAGANDTRE